LAAKNRLAAAYPPVDMYFQHDGPFERRVFIETLKLIVGIPAFFVTAWKITNPGDSLYFNIHWPSQIRES